MSVRHRTLSPTSVSKCCCRRSEAIVIRGSSSAFETLQAWLTKFCATTGPPNCWRRPPPERGPSAMRRSWPSTVAEKDLDGRTGELGGEGAADRTGADDCSGHGERTPSNGKTRRLSS